MHLSVDREILINAPVDVVWRTVTEPDQIRRWFADEVDLRPTPGYQGSLTFHQPAPAPPRVVQVSVQAVQPHRSFAYRWEHPPGTGAHAGNSTLVEFTLTPHGDGTRLRVVEHGLEETEWASAEQSSFAEEHRAGWDRYLSRLRDLVDGPSSSALP